MSTAKPAPTPLQQYLFQDAANDAERNRLIIQHQLMYPSFATSFNQILDEWGLAQKLEAASKDKYNIAILDIGCGEGLFLYDIANILTQRGLLSDKLMLYGVDKDKTAIATAEEFCKQQTNSRVNLEFYVHDVTTPLADCEGFQWHSNDSTTNPQFDLILASQLFEHLPQAQSHLNRIYSENLKPGGILYVRDFSFAPDGWLAPHPFMHKTSEKSCQLVLSLNGGIDVAQNQEKWLENFGADILSVTQTKMATGPDEKGLLAARNFVMITRNVAPILIKVGLITQAEYDEGMAQIFKEFSAEAVGYLTSFDIVARKP